MQWPSLCVHCDGVWSRPLLGCDVSEAGVTARQMFLGKTKSLWFGKPNIDTPSISCGLFCGQAEFKTKALSHLLGGFYL